MKNAKLVIIDECSMVDETVGRDLMSFAVPILVLGDPEQLPPVKGAGFFTEAPPDILLTEIHRQARDNPILSLATSVREGERIVPGLLGDSIVVRRADLDPARVTGADQVLVGMNRTRTVFNRRFREIRGTLARSPVFPVVDERIICLRNDRSKGLLNGGIWNVEKVLSQEQSGTRMIVSPIDAGTVQQNVQVAVLREFFEGRERDLEWDRRRQSDEFDFAYAITVHKSQGSQWDDVTLFDESAVFSRDARRWLYTGITRAAKRVTVVLN